MGTYPGKREQRRRQAWMTQYDKLMIERKPRTAGKQDWDAALHLYLKGMSPSEAVEFKLS